MTAGSVRRCLGSYQRSGPLGLLQKMLLDSSIWGSTIVYLTWKVKVMKPSRFLFQLVPSTPRTGGIESSLWATPTTQEVEHPQSELTQTGRRKTKDGTDSHSLGLADQVGNMKMWPTPTGRDHKDTGDCENVEDNGLLGRVVNPSKESGSLNPNWVEWLQGFPPGWTDLSA